MAEKAKKQLRKVTTIGEMEKIVQRDGEIRMASTGQFVWEMVPDELMCLIDNMVEVDRYGRAFNQLITYHDEGMLVEANLRAKANDCYPTDMYWCQVFGRDLSVKPCIIKPCDPALATHVAIRSMECYERFRQGLLNKTEYYAGTYTNETVQEGWLVVPAGYQAMIDNLRLVVDAGLPCGTEFRQFHDEQVMQRAGKYRLCARPQYEKAYYRWRKEEKVYGERLMERQAFNRRLESARAQLIGIDETVLLEVLNMAQSLVDSGGCYGWLLITHEELEEKTFRWCGTAYCYDEGYVTHVEVEAARILHEARTLQNKVDALTDLPKHQDDWYFMRKMCIDAKVARIPITSYVKELDKLVYQTTVCLPGARVEFHDAVAYVWCDSKNIATCNYTAAGLVHFSEAIAKVKAKKYNFLYKFCDLCKW